MKKTLKIFTPIFLVAFAFLLSACSLGGYTVTFIDYKGNFVEERTYSSDEAVTNSNSPWVAGRDGFTFVGWTDVEDDSIKENYSTDRVMEATYKINVNDSTFVESGRKVEYYGSTASASTYFSEGQTKVILIRDRISYGNFTSVSVSGSTGSGFGLADMKVYDKDGKIVENNYSALFGVWQPGERPDLGEYDYIIEITATTAGQVDIVVQ